MSDEIDMDPLMQAIQIVANATADSLSVKFEHRIEELERAVLRLNAITMELSTKPSKGFSDVG